MNAKEEMVSRTAADNMMMQVEHDVASGMMMLFREVLKHVDAPRPVKIDYDTEQRALRFQIGSDDPKFLKLTLDLIDPEMN